MANAAFTALVNDVYTITKRSDLVTETEYALRAATLKLHQLDFFPKDIVESKVNFSVADYYQTLAYQTLFPRMRSLSYMRKFEGGAPTQIIEVISPTDILDDYGIAKENVAYVAGAAIQIRSNTQITDILMGYYANPVTTPDDYVSWVASVYPYAIVSEAAATVFATIGYDEQAAKYRSEAQLQAIIVKNSNIVGEAF